jgi:hypothetical protein
MLLDLGKGRYQLVEQLILIQSRNSLLLQNPKFHQWIHKNLPFDILNLFNPTRITRQYLSKIRLNIILHIHPHDACYTPASRVNCCLFRNGASSLTRGGVWLLPVPPLLVGVTRADTPTSRATCPPITSAFIQEVLWTINRLLSESELLYDWRIIANQLVLAPSPLRPTTSIFLTGHLRL